MRKHTTITDQKSQCRTLSPLTASSEAALPDCAIIPEQFFAPPSHSAAHKSGVKRLLLAVLQDAVACWFRYQHARNARGQRLFRETHDWFWATEQDSLFAFEHICAQLQLDPDYIRQGLLRWQPSSTGTGRPRPPLRSEPVVRDLHLVPPQVR
ncbi:MAG: hypothetical protein NZ578_03950 [Candidatus Binatia bacterium]|nr:hypothetical protein [Candidatus Binatia bacterium]